MVLVRNGESIECSSASIVTRKLVIGSLVTLPNIGRCRKYQCKLNSEAKITKCIERALHKASSHIEMGDTLSAENLVVYVASLKALKYKVVKESGRHNAQLTETPEYTFAEITQTFHNYHSLVGQMKEIR